MPIYPNDYADHREMPRYSVSEAAQYLGISRSTLRTWVNGRKYSVAGGLRQVPPIIIPASSEPRDPVLSFYNLAESYVLSSLRLGHEVKLAKIRSAISWLREQYPVSHPLLNHDFFTNGIDVFVKKLLGRKIQTINASASGQLGIGEIVNPYLRRIEKDGAGHMLKIYPSIPDVQSPKVISLVHNLSAGRPIVDRVGVRASVIWSRFKAGEKVSELADDYEITDSEVTAAIEYVEAIKARSETTKAKSVA